MKVGLDPERRTELEKHFTSNDLHRSDHILEITSASLAAIGFRSIDIHIRIAEEKNWKGAIGIFTTPFSNSFRRSMHPEFSMPSHTVSITRENLKLMLHPDAVDENKFQDLDEYHAQLLAGYIYIMICPEVAQRVNADIQSEEQDPLEALRRQIEDQVKKREQQSADGTQQQEQTPQEQAQQAELRKQEERYLEECKERDLLSAQSDLANSTIYGLKGTLGMLEYFDKGLLPENRLKDFPIQDLSIDYYDLLCTSYLHELNKK